MWYSYSNEFAVKCIIIIKNYCNVAKMTVKTIVFKQTHVGW